MGAITGVRGVDCSGVYKTVEVKIDKREIRLLEIEPSKSYDDPIRGNLQVVSLATSPKYTALSYVWGRKREPGEAGTRHIVHCGDYEVEVTSNCIDALRCIRKEMSQTRERIWVDAICINEDNVKERNHQVGLMGDIYSEAHTVYIWLGKGGSQVDRGMRLLSDIARKKETRAHPSLNVPGVGLIVYDHLRATAMRVVKLGQSVESDFTHLTVFASISQKDIEAVYALLNRTWFFRGWTFQEFMLAKNPIFLCGSNRLAWPLFRDAIRWLEEYTEFHVNRVPLYAEALIRSTSALCSVYDALERRRLSHLEALDELLDDDHMGIVHALRYRDVGNPKDKSFALYGVLRSMDVNVSNPDYRKPKHLVYKELFMDLLRWRPAYLSLLLDAGQPAMPDSPSWVPQWDRPLSHKWIPDHDFSPQDQSEPKSILVITEDELHLRARFVDVVEHVVDFSSLENHPKPELECIPPLRKWLVNLRRLRKTHGAVGDERQIVFAALCANRATDYERKGEPISYSKFSPWYSIMMGEYDLEPSLRSKFARSTPFATTAPPASSSNFICSYDAKNPREVLALLRYDTLAFEFHHYICTMAKCRSIFSTQNRYVMTGPPTIKPLDRIALLAGIKVPVVLRHMSPMVNTPPSERSPPLPALHKYCLVGPTLMDPSLKYVRSWGEIDYDIVLV